VNVQNGKMVRDGRGRNDFLILKLDVPYMVF
jgi:hypothetical protein